MTPFKTRMTALRAALAAILLLGVAACATPDAGQSAPGTHAGQSMSLLPQRQEMAISQAAARRAQGQRVWCVPFARDLSGIDLRGNAGTWWNAAQGVYARGKEPQVGAVMVFSAGRNLRVGHLAVVSEVVSPREIRIDHANWERNRVTLRQRVVDVSPRNDWSMVRVESVPGTLGRPYSISGFVYNQRVGRAQGV
ncbi:CHAP domain-containing protein [Paracoccus bogoriensis]|uniref:CHAP domain-containing protein n=1 Tax=Paracoccus bogoriensis TaxID=242065 RepID=UPI001FE77C49|nr:CHAP domain-containing protein [Paracoccus bogoriensis]